MDWTELDLIACLRVRLVAWYALVPGLGRHVRDRHRDDSFLQVRWCQEIIGLVGSFARGSLRGWARLGLRDIDLVGRRGWSMMG